jgi:hypothetical protein
MEPLRLIVKSAGVVVQALGCVYGVSGTKKEATRPPWQRMWVTSS